MTATILGIALMILGVSFAYKCILAAFFGKTYYWSGFLPITLVSPMFIHWPPGKKSLIKTMHAWWIHVTLGPIFFFATLVCFAAGADQLGLPGTIYINYFLSMGRPDVAPAIVYDKETGYKFPILSKASDTIIKGITGVKLDLKEDEKLHPDSGDSRDEAKQR